MRADKVKPGMLVRRDDCWAVVTTRWAGGRIGFADPSLPELILNPDGDVEAVRLTAPQVEALRTVSKGGRYRLTEQRTGTISWWASGTRAGSPVPFARITELGLIEPDPDLPNESWQDKSYDYFTLSPSGRALLDLLDKEGK